MRRTATILIIAAALIVVYSRTRNAPASPSRTAATPAQPTVPEHLIVLADITNSLRGDEINATYKLVADIFRLAPEETEIIVFPIATEVATAQGFEGRVPAAPVPAAQKIVRAWREAKESEVLRLLQEAADSSRSHDQQYASCISVALKRAAGILQQTGGGANTHIIVISDMVEECRNSVIGGPVRLIRQDLRPFIRAASALKSPMDLKGARVVTFFPSAASSGNPHASRPDRAALQEFWNAVLQQSNADMKSSKVDADFRQYLVSLEIDHEAIDAAEREPPRLKTVSKAPPATSSTLRQDPGHP